MQASYPPLHLSSLEARDTSWREATFELPMPMRVWAEKRVKEGAGCQVSVGLFALCPGIYLPVFSPCPDLGLPWTRKGLIICLGGLWIHFWL